MAYYLGIYFDRQDIIKAFKYIYENGAPKGFYLHGLKYNIAYNGLAYCSKALFKVIADNRNIIIGKFICTSELRNEFKKEGFEIIEIGSSSKFINTSSKPVFDIEENVSSKKCFVIKKTKPFIAKDFKELFNFIMNSLFSDNNKEKTIEYYKNTKCREISSKSGIYVAKNSENKDLEILEKPEILLYDKPSDTGTHNEYEAGFKNKCKYISNLYLYIGKADNEIKGRLEKYINYGYGGHDAHRGGYHLWFVKNNKNLYINYATVTEIKEKQSELYEQTGAMLQKYSKKYGKSKSISEIIEMGLICLHDLAYGYAPLANSQNQSEYKSYKENHNSIGSDIYKEWKKYWTSKLNK